MEPVVIDIKGTRQALGVGTTTVYKLIGEGRLSTVKIGRRTLVRTDSIRALVAAA